MSNNQQIDESKLTFENLQYLDNNHLKAFQIKYQEESFPKYRQYAFVAYNVVFGCMCYKLTRGYRVLAKKYIKPRGYGLTDLFKYGTLWSIVFVGSYVLGTILVTGIYNPINYINSLARIQGRLIDDEIKYDERFQKYLLFDAMEYFNVDEETRKKIKEKLDLEKQEYLEKNPGALSYFQRRKSITEEIDSLDDDEDDEE